MTRKIPKLRFFTIVAFFFMLTGCDAPEVVIAVSPEYANATIQVDFVKVPRSEMVLWMAKDLDQYFAKGDVLRQSAETRGIIYSVYYNVPDRPFKPTIPNDDPVWKRFKFDTGSNEQDFDILVLADIPGVFDPGAGDPRRRVIPLHKKAWSASFLSRLFGGGSLDRLTVTITPGGILLDPSPAQ